MWYPFMSFNGAYGRDKDEIKLSVTETGASVALVVVVVVLLFGKSKENCIDNE